MTRTYLIASLVVCLSLPVAVAGFAYAVPAYLVALAVVLLAFALAVVVAELTATVPYATIGWVSDAAPVVAPVHVAPCGGSPSCDCLVESPVTVVRTPRKPRVQSVPVVVVPVVKRVKVTKRVAATSSKPARIAPKQPRVRKAPSA